MLINSTSSPQLASALRDGIDRSAGCNLFSIGFFKRAIYLWLVDVVLEESG